MLGTGQLGVSQLGATPYVYVSAQAQAYLTDARDQNIWGQAQGYLTDARDQNIWGQATALIGHIKDNITQTELFIIRDTFQLVDESLGGFTKNTGSADPGYISDNFSGWLNVRFPDDCTVTITTNGSNYDTMLALFSGTPGSLTPIVRDDDSGDGYNSIVTANVLKDVDYYIEISSYIDAGYLTTLTITSPQFPLGITDFGQAMAYITFAVDQTVSGLSMAFIGPLWIGQAQAKIKGIGQQVYAQAQTSIRGRVYGQAKAYIKAFNTSRVGQARALVDSTRVYAQAEASIYQPNPWLEFYFAQVQAQILAFDRTAYGQAQAYISPTTDQQVYAQTQAIINQVLQTGQAQAKIAVFGFAQAQAYILGNAFAQAEAFIDQPNPWLEFYFAQAKASILALNQQVYAQANAWIGLPGITTLFSDTFSRIDNSGTFGTPDIGAPYTFMWTGGSSTWAVDGSVGKITVPMGSHGGKDLYLMRNGGYFHDFEMYMEIRYTGLTYPYTGSGYPSSYWIFRDINSDWNYGAYFWFSNGGTAAYMYALSGSQTGTYSASVSYNYTIWNALKFKFEGANMYMKFWPLTDPEPPSWILSATLTNALDINAAGAIVIEPYINYPISSEGTAEIDNIRVTGWGTSPYNQGYAQAQASILTSYQKYSQALATIDQFQLTGQAQADINLSALKYAQARAFIRKSAGYGQARAFLPTITVRRGSGLARPTIIRAGTPFAFQRHATALALIKSHIFVMLGQARGYVYRGGYGQARAWILPPTVRGQAQASIKQTYPLPLTSYPDIVMGDSPDAYWPMDDGSSATVVELVAGKNGTLSGSGSIPTALVPNGSRFVGMQWASGRYLTSNFYQPSTSVAVVEAWFATTGTGELWQGRYGDSGSGGNGITLSLSSWVGLGDADGYLNFYTNSDGFMRGVRTTSQYNDGLLHHVVAKWVGASGTSVENAQFTIWVDGAAASITGLGNASGRTAPLAGNATHGYFLGYTYGAYTGWISNIAFYTHDLTDGQITNHFSQGVSAPYGAPRPFSQAQTYIGHFGYAQARTWIKFEGQQYYSQTQALIGHIQTSQAISQIGYDVLGYRKAVLLDDPILYYPLDEESYGDSKLHSIVARIDAVLNDTGETFGVTGSPSTSGTSIKFNTRYGLVTIPTPYESFGPTSLVFPGPNGASWWNGQWMNMLSRPFYGRAGDTVSVTITTNFSGGSNLDVGIWHSAGAGSGGQDNQWASNSGYGTTGSVSAGNTWTWTLTQTGAYIIYSWGNGFNSGLAGAGTYTYKKANRGPLTETVIPSAATEPITVEFWMKWDGSDSGYPFWISNSVGLRFYGGRFGFTTGNGGSLDIYGISSTGLANTWVHVAAVFYAGQDPAGGTAGSGTPNKLYINGVAQSLTQTGSPFYYSFAQTFQIGDGSWAGWLDEFAIFNYELSAGQVLVHYLARTNFGQAHAQARMTDARDQNYYAQANALIGHIQPAQAQAWVHAFDVSQSGQAQTFVTRNGEGLVRLIWQGSAFANTPDNWTNWDIEDAGSNPNYDSSTLPLPNFSGVNGGAAWTARFTADATGTWRFAINSDDGSELYINNTLVVNRSWGGFFPEGRTEGSIPLTAGTEYNLHARWGQGGGPYAIRIQYKRPLDSVWYYLTENKPPWLQFVKSSQPAQAIAEIIPAPFIQTWGQAQADINATIYGYAQAQAKLNAFDVNGSGQAQTFIGHFQHGQAKADILQTYQSSGQAQTFIGHFHSGQAKADIVQTYIVYAQANSWIIPPTVIANAQAKLNSFDQPHFGQANAWIKAYDVNRFGQAATLIILTTSGQAQSWIKQTYPIMGMDINYALESMGATAIDSHADVVAATRAIDGNDYGQPWVIGLSFGQFLRVDLGQSRTINFYRILPVNYDVTVSLMYYHDYYGWLDVVTGIQFAVGPYEDIDTSRAVIGEIPPLTARHWQIYITALGTYGDSAAISSFELGWATVKSPTFAQAQAYLGHVRMAQAMAYISPGVGFNWGQALGRVKKTYQVYAQAKAWIIPPTFIGQATGDILQVYMTQSYPRAWIIPPTVIGSARARIVSYNVVVVGQATADIWKEYRRIGQAKAQITKTAGYGLALGTVKDRYHGKVRGNARARIGARDQHGYALAYIIKNWKFAQAKTAIKKTDVEKVGQARAFIWQFIQWGNSNADILQTYVATGIAGSLLNTAWGFGIAKGTILQVYSCSAQAQVRIKQTYRQPAQALAIIRVRHIENHAQARAVMTTQRALVAQAMAWIGYHKFSQAQARIVTFSVPRIANAGAYILGSIIPPVPVPSSNYYSYLVRYNDQDMPGYAQEEAYDSAMRVTTRYAVYINRSLSEYQGLENKTITMKMRVWENTYAECKIQVIKAGTIFRSSRKGFTKLYIQSRDKYYLALAKRLSMVKNVSESMRIIDYYAEFETKPWLISNDIYTLSGTGSIDTGASRTLSDGGWTPTTVTVSGTNISITGVNENGDSLGTITVTGTVSSMVIDTEAFTATDTAMINKDFSLYLGPGKNYFTITGATSCTIQWQNRWYL